MAQINLRDYYPDFYKEDYMIEAPDEVLEVMQEAKRKEAAYQRKRYRYKAYYSLDRDDGIEHDTLYKVLTPQDIYEQQEQLEQLRIAMALLPEKQARRLRAHYFFGMSMTEIAYVEGVHRSQISRSISRALTQLAIFLKNFR